MTGAYLALSIADTSAWGSVVEQQVKPTSVGIPPPLLPIWLPANVPEKVPFDGVLTPMRETQLESWAPGYGLTQPGRCPHLGSDQLVESLCVSLFLLSKQISPGGCPGWWCWRVVDQFSRHKGTAFCMELDQPLAPFPAVNFPARIYPLFLVHCRTKPGREEMGAERKGLARQGRSEARADRHHHTAGTFFFLHWQRSLI